MSIVNNSTAAKLAAGLIGLAMAFSFVGATSAQAQTVEDLTAQINALLETIAQLQADLATLQGGGSTSAVCPYTWTVDLTNGSTGADVLNLQKFLNNDSDTQVAASGVGSAGNETDYFGSLTRGGVTKFQDKYATEVLTPVGLSAGTGYFGPSTRAHINSLCTTSAPSGDGDGDVGGGDVSGTGITVLAGVQPANTLAPQSAARVPFTTFSVTAGSDGDVVMDSVTVERTGLANDSAFAGIVLLDGSGVQLGTAKVLNSSHQVKVGEAVTIPSGQTRNFTIAGNMATDLSARAGEVASLAIVGINTSATVSGSLPITGAAHTINASLALGTAAATLSSFDPNTSSTKEIGITAYKFSGVKIEAGSAEKIRIQSIKWNQTGSVSGLDLGNVVTVVDGVEFPTTLSADGNFYTTTFPGGLLIDKGFSKDIYIKADIVGSNAAGRTAVFDIDESTDIFVTGELYGYGITVTQSQNGTASDSASQFTSGTPFFDGSLVTISAGTATSIGKSNSVPAQNIAVNVPSQVLGGFETDFKGEAVTVQTMIFTIATTSGGSGTGLLTNVTLVDENGAVVSGPFDAVRSGSNQTVTFTDAVTFPVGKMIYTLKGKVASGAGNGVTYTVSTTPSAWTNVRGDVTGDTITLSQGNFSMNVMTVKAAALSISVSSDPAAQNIVAGVQDFTYANIQLDATASGEDVRFASIPLLLQHDGTLSGAPSNLTTCQLFDGGVALNTSTVVNPSDASTGTATSTADAESTFTLDNSLVITKGTVKTLALKCDLAGGADDSSTYQWGIAASPVITVTGVTSSNDVTETVTGGDGQLMTVAAGSFTVVKDSSSPSYAIAAAGTTNVTLGILKLRATNEELVLEKLAVVMTGTSASSSPADLVGQKVSIWDGTIMLGEAVFTGSNRNATSTFTTTVTLPKDTDKILVIKGDLAAIGTSQVGTQGALIKVDYDGNTDGATNSLSKGTEAVGSGSGRVESSSTSDTAVDGVRVFRSLPTFAKLSVPSTVLVTSTMDLYRFSVTADTKGSIGLYKITVNIATSSTPSGTSSTTVKELKIKVYTDSGFTNTVSGFSPAGQLNAAIAGLLSSDNTSITFDASTQGQDYLQIPAGATYYFRVIGDVALTGGPTGGSITTNIQGDANYPIFWSGQLMATSTNTDAFTDANGDDFIWSPNATTTSETTNEDWTNGHFMQGLPSDNSDSVTIVK